MNIFSTLTAQITVDIPLSPLAPRIPRQKHLKSQLALMVSYDLLLGVGISSPDWLM
jgi:hypothetical protein